MRPCMGSLQKLMRSTGLYSLKEGDLTEAELLSYAAVLEEIERLLADTAQEAIPLTAEDSGLLAYEELLGQDRSGLSVDRRRDMIIYALSMQPKDFDRQGIVRALRSLGIETEITEQTAEERITVKITEFSGNIHDYDKLREDARGILPAHLETVFEMSSFTWEEFDTKDLTWEEFESNSFSWDEFEINGSQLKK